jgi:polar amino acid transport system substrate-binding protein
VSLVFWLHGTASKRCCELKGGPYLEPKYFGDGMAIAVPKNDQQIKMLINGALARLRANGRLDEIVERYFPIKIY